MDGTIAGNIETMQGRIQDFKLGGGGALKKIAPNGGRCENFGGISCEKSWFYTKKIIFLPILGGCAPPESAPAYYKIQMYCTQCNGLMPLANHIYIVFIRPLSTLYILC